MTYTPVQPPFTLKFREMSKEELRAYDAWFHEALPGRIEMLGAEVKGAEGFESWKPDGTPGSFDALGEWLAGQVRTRPRTQGEKEAVLRAAAWVTVPDEELTGRTFSLAMDVGMYFGRSILAARPGARWEQPLENERFADYGQPVIGGLGPVTLNPVRIAVTLAYALAAGRRTGKRLRELYDYWVRQGAERGADRGQGS